MYYNDLTTPDPKAIIIAEAGINHDGDIEKAIRMIDVAAEAGADYVKFQSFQAQKLVTPDALTSSYIKEGSNEGESFEDLAKALSIGPSGPNGGDLGFFQRGDMVPSFADASFSLEIGAVSPEPVQTNFGWHIIKVEDRRVIPMPPLEEISNQLGQAMASELATKIADELYEKAKIRRLDLDQLLSSQ